MSHHLAAPLDVKLMNWTASVLFLGLAAAVVWAGSWWVMRHPGFAISRIVVQGELAHNNAVTLRANVAPHLVGNFFTFDLSAARDAFEQVPWVRRAQVRREYPSSLLVELQEHDAVAYWGAESSAALVNSYGEVFDANVTDVELEGLPRLSGPEGSSAEVLEMQGLLAPVFARLDLEVQELVLSGRGGWRTTLDSGAVVELGGGLPAEVVLRAERFARSLAQVTANFGRRADALESADLRHEGGYALKLRGVTTVTAEAAAAAASAALKRR